MEWPANSVIQRKWSVSRSNVIIETDGKVAVLWGALGKELCVYHKVYFFP